MRSLDRLQYHYQIEHQLADRLKETPSPGRTAAYMDVYDELFSQVLDHPQLAVTAAERQRVVAGRLRLLRRFLTPASAFMEIGAGDCALSISVARFVRRVVAVDVSAIVMAPGLTEPNIDPVITDGTSLPVDEDSIDVAFSDQLLEHLHPDDVAEHLTQVLKALTPGGRYVCITPNRLTGPHDISRLFTSAASGLHLREYSGTELSELFHEAGFQTISFYAGAGGRYVRLPGASQRVIEYCYASRSDRPTRPSVPMLTNALLGVTAVATKAGPNELERSGPIPASPSAQPG